MRPVSEETHGVPVQALGKACETSCVSFHDLETHPQDFLPLPETPRPVSDDPDGVPLLPGKRPDLELSLKRLGETPTRLGDEDVEETSVMLI